MLGSMVCSYYRCNNIDIETTNFKWDSNEFKRFIKNNKCDFLINCIGINPHKHPNQKSLKSINFDLPNWLSTNFSGHIIHPASNAEFSGDLKVGKLYQKWDYKSANDEYGVSKATSSILLSNKNNVKQIRTSIIGPEIDNKIYLMEWLLNSKSNKIKGYINHYWNGITTLEWAKQSLDIIKHWNSYDNIIQIGTTPISKYDLLVLISKIFNCDKKIIPTKTIAINKCIASDYKIKNIKTQLKELKSFISQYESI